MSSFQINPTSISYTLHEASLVQALVNVLSVVGGIFMVFKVLDSYFAAFIAPAEPAQRYSPVAGEQAAADTKIEAAPEGAAHRFEASSEASI